MVSSITPADEFQDPLELKVKTGPLGAELSAYLTNRIVEQTDRKEI